MEYALSPIHGLLTSSKLLVLFCFFLFFHQNFEKSLTHCYFLIKISSFTRTSMYGLPSFQEKVISTILLSSQRNYEFTEMHTMLIPSIILKIYPVLNIFIIYCIFINTLFTRASHLCILSLSPFLLSQNGAWINKHSI